MAWKNIRIAKGQNYLPKNLKQAFTQVKNEIKMAKKIEIELQAKTDHAVNEIGALKGEIQKLNKEAAKGSKETSDGLKDVVESSKEASGGIKGIGTALKAAGIGLAIAAFSKLSEVFQQNQKVADFFNTSV